MAKLYPPIIEGTIPAFYGTVISVPFIMNRSVSLSEISGMKIKMKTVQNNIYILEAESSLNNIANNIVTFDFTSQAANIKLNIGQYYKIQIAYIDNFGVIGNYSTIAVTKYTAKPNIYIQNLDITNLNLHKYEYVGKYESFNDPTEKVYSYRFDIYDENNNLVITSGNQIHNSYEDISNKETIDSYTFNTDLETNQNYYIQYSIITNNKLELSSSKYKIIQQYVVNTILEAKLIVEMNYDNGYVALNFDGPEATGNFKIVRASEEDSYKEWIEVFSFSLQNQKPSSYSYKDFMVKQGINYRYAIQQYNYYGVVSNKSLYTDIFVDFEDSFLTDGERQLRIQYNPKVSSFKDILLETKTNTIGSQYPFIFRNGNVKYKEFPISGLISCLTDKDFLFVDDLLHDSTIDLTGNNIAAERKFKLKVLEWLNNGKPKVFRSPGEGNYIVRLLNNSLTPIDSVGRMLHTFSSTASEIAQYNNQNLIDLGLLKPQNKVENQIQWATIDLSTYTSGINLIKYEALSIKIEDATIGDQIRINDGILREDGTIGYTIEITNNEPYYINIKSGATFNYIGFLNDNVVHKGLLTYSYYNESKTRFDLITDFKAIDNIVTTFIGESDIINEINDIKRQVQRFYYIKCYLRDIKKCYTRNDVDFYSDINLYNSLTLSEEKLYQVTNNITGETYLLDGKKLQRVEYNSFINFNSELMDLSETKQYIVTNIENLKTFKIGNGIIAEVFYQVQELEYIYEIAESNNNEIYLLRQDLDNKYNILQTILENEESTYEDIQNAKNDYELSYSILATKLEQKILSYEGE